MTIHENIRQMRKNTGLTQEQVAEKLGVTRQALSSYESGRTRPDIDTLMRLCEIYDTDLEGILYGQDRRVKSARRVKIAAKTLFLLLLVLTFISSCFLSCANHFFKMPDGAVSSDGTAIFQARQKLIGAWETADSIILTATLIGMILLLVLCISARGMISAKSKLAYCAVLSAAVVIVSLPFALSDPVYAPVNYLITPILVIGRIAVFLIADLLAEFFLKRKEKN